VTASRHAELLLATGQTLVSLDSLAATDQLLSRGPFTHVSAAPNGKALALLTASGLLWVVAADLQRGLAELDTAAAGVPAGGVRQVVWCGSDAVLLVLDGAALLVGPFGDVLRYYYAGAVHATGERDGVRLLSPDACEFVEKVPGTPRPSSNSSANTR
jgi:hypothetical protein